MPDPDTSTPEYILMHRFGRKRLDPTKGPVRQNFAEIQEAAQKPPQWIGDILSESQYIPSAASTII